jgi:serine-type D-Ala-D-Ala carboxypeptidase (penicillin-binding protein 5/6)
MSVWLRRAAPCLLALAVVAVIGGPAASQPVPPPTPVPPANSPSPYPTALETPVPSADPPRITGESGALGELDQGTMLWARRGRARRPIASVTKIMTALLVLEETRPGEVATASAEAASQSGAELGMKAGERLPVRDLLLALMLQSANDAAVALAEHVSGTVDAFVADMNRRARELGLGDTRFASPNGLDDSGYSTARDLVALSTEAFDQAGFARIVATRFHRIPDPNGDPRRIQNRNALLWLYPGAVGVKTGYTSAAGFCLVAAADREGLSLVAVVLDAPDEAFSDAAAILNHGYATYEQRTVISQDQQLDPIEVDGQPVPVVATTEVEALLSRGEPVTLTVRPDPALGLPIDDGQAVGVVEATAAGVSVGRSPVVAAEATARAVPAETPQDEPWWMRALQAVGRFFTRIARAIFG